MPPHAHGSAPKRPRVLIVTGRRLFGETLAACLRLDGLDARAVQSLPDEAARGVDVLLLDAGFDSGPGLAGMTGPGSPAVRILPLCWEDTPDQVADAVRLAAASPVVPILRSVNRAAVPASLTDRELDVVALMAEGHCNDEIAGLLAINSHTVRTHVQNLLAKLQVTSRFAAVAEAQRAGLIGASLPSQRTGG